LEIEAFLDINNKQRRFGNNKLTVLEDEAFKNLEHLDYLLVV
jgi:hypothetical protein